MKRKTTLWVLVLSCVVSVSAFGADKKTERLFNSKCAACHGKDGKGQTEKGQKMGVRDMGTADYQKPSDADFKKVILEGLKKEKDGKKQEMDPYKEELKDDEVDALIKMVREFKK